MLKILRTSHLERAARALHERHKRVLIRAKTGLWTQIRIKRRALADLNPFVCMSPKEFDAQRDEWNRDGGMLIYERGYGIRENIAAHHAQLVVECPLSIEELRGYLHSAREVAVVYEPPTWKHHEECVHYNFPPAEICKRFYRAAKQGDTNAAIGKAIGINEPFTCMSDEYLRAALGVGAPHLWRIRDATLRHRDWKMVNRVIPRIPPPDPTLAEVYAYILRECPEVNGERLIVGSMLSKAARFWKVALKALPTQGAVAKKETLFCYLLSGLEPDWEAIELAHLNAMARLTKVREFVESLPELDLPPLQSPARPARSRSLSASS